MMERVLAGLEVAVASEPETYTEPRKVTIEQFRLTRELVAKNGVGKKLPVEIAEALRL